LGKANEPKPRANPDHGTRSIQEYLGVPWSGKRVPRIAELKWLKVAEGTIDEETLGKVAVKLGTLLLFSRF